MINVLVSLNGEEFEVLAKGDVYNNELPDFTHAVQAALNAHFLAHPLDPLDSASLEVSIKRVYQDTAARDGKGVEKASRERSSWGLARGPSADRDPAGDARQDTEDPDSLSEAELEARTAPESDNQVDLEKDE